MAYEHYILTKFNLGLYSNPNKRRVKVKPDVWMEHRLSLFEKVTLSSIKNQSCQNFSWLLLVDKHTPEKFIRRMEDFNYSNIKICCNDWEITNGNFDIITTRIDNDDAFHVDFIKEIQHKYAELDGESKPFGISFPLGYIMDLKFNQIIVQKCRTNNCPSLVAMGDKQNFKTCRVNHSRFPSKFRTFFIHKSEPFWLVTIHSHNLRNHRLRKHFRKSQEKNIPDSILLKFGISKSRK